MGKILQAECNQKDSQFDGAALATATAADTLTSDRVASLGYVHQARLARVNRILSAVTLQYGEKSKEAVAAQTAVAVQQDITTRVDVIHTQTTATAPTVSATGWAVWGNVYDSASKEALAGYTVFLVDAEKAYQRAYGFAYTDAAGAFTINYAGASTPSGAQSANEQNPAPAASQPNAPSPSDTAPTSTIPNLFLSIANTEAQQVYLGTQPLALAFGTALYVTLYLPAGEPALGDPPEEIRNIAFPSEKDEKK